MRVNVTDVENTHRSDTRRIHFAVRDAEPIYASFPVECEIVPDRVEIILTRSQEPGYEWSQWVADAAEIRGPKVLSSGRVSKRREGTRRVWLHNAYDTSVGGVPGVRWELEPAVRKGIEWVLILAEAEVLRGRREFGFAIAGAREHR